MNNPLQQFFRQPKIYIKLPSKGLFTKLGALQGDVANAPIYGMTGMDEILMKTPDALLTGESTASVMQSCCPVVKDAWELSTIDVPMILAAIRIATYGSMLPIQHVCANCGAENEYDVDLTKFIDFYNRCNFDNTITMDNLVIKVQPLTYKQSTEFSLRNFQLQQRLAQTEGMEDKTERNKIIKDLFAQLGEIQNDVYMASVESVEIPQAVVTERTYINEWLLNCDTNVFTAIKAHNEKNKALMTPPKFPVTCDGCNTETQLSVDLDQSNFFDKA
jgi:hypothetical protein